jgi:hypothetical protein
VCSAGGSFLIAVVLRWLTLASEPLADRGSTEDSSAFEPVGEDRAQHRGSDRAADRAKQRRSGRGHAEIAVFDRVLHRQHEHLHHAAEPQPQDEHERRGLQMARVSVQRREQDQPRAHDRRARNRERPVVPGAADDLAGADRGQEQARASDRRRRRRSRGRCAARIRSHPPWRSRSRGSHPSDVVGRNQLSDVTTQ